MNPLVDNFSSRGAPNCDMADHTYPGTVDIADPIAFRVHGTDPSLSIEQAQQVSTQLDLSKNVQEACLNTLVLLDSRSAEQPSLAHLQHVDDADGRSSPFSTTSGTASYCLPSGGTNGGVICQVRS